MITLRYEPIPADFYEKNRDALAKQLPEGALVVVHANDVYPTNADGTLPHHQNANFFYLTGVEQEESALIMRIGKKGAHKDTLLLRETNEHVVIWEGARLTQAEGTQLSGIKDVQWNSAYQALLAKYVPTATSVWLERDNHPRRLTYVQTRNERMGAALQAAFTDAKQASIHGLMAEARLVKAREEV